MYMLSNLLCSFSVGSYWEHVWLSESQSSTCGSWQNCSVSWITGGSDGAQTSLKCSHLASQPTAFLSIIIKRVKLAVTTVLALILQSFFPQLHHSCSILQNARKSKRLVKRTVANRRHSLFHLLYMELITWKCTEVQWEQGRCLGSTHVAAHTRTLFTGGESHQANSFISLSVTP